VVAVRTEDLIITLAQSATPVRVVRPTLLRLAQWAVMAFAIAAVVVWAVGPRADVAVALGQPRFLLPATAILATALLSAAAALALNIPGVEWSPAQRLLPLMTGGLWAVLLFVWLRQGGDAWTRIAAMPIHLLCVLLVSVLAGLSGNMLTTMLARGASLQPAWTAAFAWIAAASTGALAAHIVCPIDDPAHHLTGHFAPFVLVALAGSSLTQQSLRLWRRASKDVRAR
jgi:hypothetical protein